MTDLSNIVKPLVWIELDRGEFGHAFVADGLGVEYEAGVDVDGQAYWEHHKVVGHTGALVSGGISAAKAAAQAAHARRVLFYINTDVLAACVRAGLEMGAQKAAIHNLGRSKERSDRQLSAIRALASDPDAITAAVERAAGKGGE